MQTPEMIDTLINGRWTLKLPKHRAERPEWVTGWEPERLDALWNEIKAMRINSAINTKANPIVIDVGAEEGDMSALMASWGAEMYLIEPNKKVWPNIAAIFEANNLPLPWTFAGFAASATRIDDVDSQTITHGFPLAAHGNISIEHGFNHLAENDQSIPKIAIDDLPMPDIITIDVEGSEYQVLKGAIKTLTIGSPTLFISVHPEFMFHNHNEYEGDMHAWLRSLGYRGKHLAYDHEHHWEYRK